MEDIAPQLLEAIRAIFVAKSGELAVTEQTWKAAEEYARQVGSALAEAFGSEISSAVLPDGRMYWNIADRVVRPMLEEDHRLVSDVAAQVQQALNEAAGIGLKAQTVPVNQDRIDGILNKLSNALQYDDVAWVLGEPVINFSQAVVDETIQANVDFQGKAGLQPRVVRTVVGGCCKWCSDLAGTYSYPNVPKDVYRRHERCRCLVEYDPGSGKRQNVWTKRWTEDAAPDKIEARKTVGLRDSPSVIASKYKRFDYSTAVFAGRKDLNWHWEKHQDEFPGWTKEQYLERAREVLSLPLQTDELEQLTRSDGSISRYCYSTNEFVATTRDGNLRTFFRPKHGKEYWDDEAARN